MAYSIKEIYPTLQGEGVHTGRPAVFCRFTGCNLWSGREADRAQATCRFCDTDFRGVDGPGGGRFEGAEELADRLAHTWEQSPHADQQPYVVFTGGEPLLQLDDVLVSACHARGFQVGVETNGTLPAPEGIDWICVSPKAGTVLAQRTGHELKVVYPQAGIDLAALESLPFRHFFLQPLDDEHANRNLEATREQCRVLPHWTLSLQTHKLLGIP